MTYYTLAGASYAPAPHPVHGIVFQKAARKSTLNTGDTKVVNGVTYTFNENRRWARADKKSRSRRSSPGANKMPPNVAVPVLEDAPKVKGKSRRMTPPAAPKANTEEIARQARRSAPRAMSAEGLKPKGKPAQVKPKAKAEAKPKASSGDKTKAVLEAANATQTGRLGDSKVFISHVWDTVQKQHPGMFKSREDFNKHLLEANRKRDMDLSRADMAYALNQDDVKGSELTHQNSSYHFIRLDGNTPPAKAEAKPKAKAEGNAKKQPKPKEQSQGGNEVEDLKSQLAELQKQIAKLEAENKQLQANASAGANANTLGPKINSAKEFESEAMKIYDRLNEDYNLGDLVPIYRIRRELGDRVSRSQFKEWLMEMQANDQVQLMGGQVPSVTQDQREDSIVIPGGGMRFYVKRL